MPRKSRFNHPVRQVRKCLGRSQAAFAKFVGCSTVAIQRIENGTLPLSAKLANTITEATGADPASLQSGPTGTAMDMGGSPYSAESFAFYTGVLPADESEFRYLALNIAHWSQLLLLAANRANQMKMRAVFAELANAFKKIGNDFHLTKSINNFLLETGHFERRAYQVSDLRKYPEFAQIIGYEDDRRHSPDKIIEYKRPEGWMPGYLIVETAVLPPDASMKLHPNAEYFIDNDRPIPRELQDIIDQAMYWKIKAFHLGYGLPE